jgi:hypothetical protein
MWAVKHVQAEHKGIKSTAFYCSHCGSIISFGANGKTPEIYEAAEIFCENCDADCRKRPINKLADEAVFRKRREKKMFCTIFWCALEDITATKTG